MKKRLMLLMVIGLIVCSSAFALFGFGKKKPTIRIGHKNFTEQRILGQMLSVMIEENTKYKTDVREFGGTMLAHEALKSGQVDIRFEYTGTGYLYLLKGEGLSNPDEIYNYCVAEFGKQGIKWLNPMGFNNTYAFAVKPELAEKYNLEKYSDLVGIAENLKVGETADFFSRPDGMPGITKTYGFSFAEEVNMDPGLKYIAVEEGQIDVAVAYSTDGMLKKYGLKVLTDDKNFFPPYDSVPVMKTEFAESYPDIVEILENFNRNFTEEEFQNYNYQVDVLGYPEKKVAEDALKAKGLI